MPPVSFRSIKESFLPDYDLLLLCDGVVMDAASFQRLTEKAPLWNMPAPFALHGSRTD